MDIHFPLINVGHFMLC